MARPKTPIDLAELERLAAIQSTQSEAAYVLDVPASTLDHRMAAKAIEEDEDGNMVEVPSPERQAWNRGKELGLQSLRRRLFKMSEKSPAVAVHLAKVYLGHTYRTEHTGAEGAPLMIPGPVVVELDPQTAIEAHEQYQRIVGTDAPDNGTGSNGNGVHAAQAHTDADTDSLPEPPAP